MLNRLVRTPAALACLVAGAAVFPAAALPPETTRLEIPSGAYEGQRQQWYGIYAEDDKLGYLKNTLQFDPAEGGRFVAVNEMHLKVVAMGEKREVRSVETLTFDGASPYRLRSGHSVVDQGPYRQEVTLDPVGTDYEARITAADTERVLEVPDPGYTVADVVTPELWFRQRRQPGEELLTRSFSLSDLRPAVDTYSVLGLKTTVVNGVTVEYYEVGLHSSVAGSIGTALFDAQGTLVSGVIGGAFELRLESAATAPDFDYSADVYLLGMVEIDVALGDARSVAGLELEVTGGDPGKIPTAARQAMTREDHSGWRLSLGAGHGEAQVATPDDVAAALEESIEYPIQDARIKDLASEAVGAAATPQERVKALVGFVDRYLTDSYSAEPLTVLDILEARKGDCTEHAMLFTTLARSLGIPTREVTGLIYLGDDVRAFGGHAWNEVALDGFWQPVDATWGEVDINATHILLGPRSGSNAATDTLFAGYSLKLVDVEHR